MEKSDYLNLVYFFCNNKNGLPYSCLADPNLVQVHSVYFRKDIRAEDDKKVIISPIFETTLIVNCFR